MHMIRRNQKNLHRVMHTRFGPQEKCMQVSLIFCKCPPPTFEKQTMWREELWSGAFMLMHVVKVSSPEHILVWMFQDKMSVHHLDWFMFLICSVLLLVSRASTPGQKNNDRIETVFQSHHFKPWFVMFVSWRPCWKLGIGSKITPLGDMAAQLAGVYCGWKAYRVNIE